MKNLNTQINSPAITKILKFKYTCPVLSIPLGDHTEKEFSDLLDDLLMPFQVIYWFDRGSDNLQAKIQGNLRATDVAGLLAMLALADFSIDFFTAYYWFDGGSLLTHRYSLESLGDDDGVNVAILNHELHHAISSIEL